MAGSIFVHAPDPSSLVERGLDAVDSYPRCELDVLLTLDFNVMATAIGVAWSRGEPIVYEDAEGLAIFEVDPEALEKVLAAGGVAEEVQQADLERLRSFVAAHGARDVYEVTTF